MEGGVRSEEGGGSEEGGRRSVCMCTQTCVAIKYAFLLWCMFP